MTGKKPPSVAHNSKAGLAEIMEVVALLESKVRAQDPADLHGIIDLINILRVTLVNSMTPRGE
jgi:hypothetical protein